MHHHLRFCGSPGLKDRVEHLGYLGYGVIAYGDNVSICISVYQLLLNRCFGIHVFGQFLCMGEVTAIHLEYLVSGLMQALGHVPRYVARTDEYDRKT